MRLNQVCAYANWADESFEIWRLYSSDRSHKEISKEMRSLFLWIFSQVATYKSIEELEHATFTIGGTDGGIEVSSSKAKKIKKRIYFGWYKGVCLDEKRLQYFRPDRIIKQGLVKLIDKNEVEICEIPNARKPKTAVPDRIFLLRKILGDDPKRLEVDTSRSRLGLQADFLFDWKEQYRIKKGKQ